MDKDELNRLIVKFKEAQSYLCSYRDCLAEIQRNCQDKESEGFAFVALAGTDNPFEPSGPLEMAIHHLETLVKS